MRWHWILAVWFVFHFFGLAQSPQVTFTCTHAGRNYDGQGNDLAAGTIILSPVDRQGNPVSFRWGGAGGGQVLASPVSAPITNGACSLVLPDTAQTSLVNACFAISITDAAGNLILGRSPSGQAKSLGYDCVQPGSQARESYWCTTASDGSITCNFDLYSPATTTLPLTQAGPVGKQGATGAAGPNQVTTSTSTNISGLLKGNGGNVSAASPGVDYDAPGSALSAQAAAQASSLQKNSNLSDVASAAAAFANIVSPLWVSTHWDTQSNGATALAELFVGLSTDGKNWNEIGNNSVIAPPTGEVCHDPTLSPGRINGLWYSACLNQTYSASSTWSLYSSPNLVNWTFVGDINAAIPSGGPPNQWTWSPTWFEDSDSSIHIMLSICPGSCLAVNIGNFNIYETHPVSSTNLAGSWSTPVKITGSALFVGTPSTTGPYNPFLVKTGTVYNLFVGNSTVMGPGNGGYMEWYTSSSPFSGYNTASGTGDWAGWGSYWEGSWVQQTGTNSWRMYAEGNLTQSAFRGEYFSDGTGCEVASGVVNFASCTWTTMAPAIALSGNTLMQGSYALWPSSESPTELISGLASAQSRLASAGTANNPGFSVFSNKYLSWLSMQSTVPGQSSQIVMYNDNKSAEFHMIQNNSAAGNNSILFTNASSGLYFSVYSSTPKYVFEIGTSQAEIMRLNAGGLSIGNAVFNAADCGTGSLCAQTLVSTNQLSATGAATFSSGLTTYSNATPGSGYNMILMNDVTGSSQNRICFAENGVIQACMFAGVAGSGYSWQLYDNINSINAMSLDATGAYRIGELNPLVITHGGTVLVSGILAIQGTTTRASGSVGYVYANGTSEDTFSSTIPYTSVSGLAGPAFATLTDGSTVTLATSGNILNSAKLTLNHATSSRTLNMTGLASGANVTLVLQQDSTGGASLALGSGCTWYLGTNSGYAASTSPSLNTAANGISILSAIYDGTNCYANVR